MAIALAFPITACAQQFNIEVTSDQRVTVVGRASSLRAVVEDVCYRAGISLLSWDADDRTFGGTYHDIPVSEFFDRLLHKQNYLLESTQAASRTRITSLRVLGDPSVAAARRAKGLGGRKRAFSPPPALLDAALSTTAAGSEEQKAALATLASSISGSPSQLQGFLSTDPKLIAEAIQRYEGVEGPLRDIQAKFPDPRISRKIDDVIAALAALLPGQAR